MLEPLKQWICDGCGEIIESPQVGFLEWLDDNQNDLNSFRIIHNLPPKIRTGVPSNPCSLHNNNKYRADHHLEIFLGASGLVYLLSKLDPKSFCDTDAPADGRVKLQEWTEIIRRLQVPYYEEARLLWSEAYADGYFDDGPTWQDYTPSALKYLINKYSKR